MKELRKQHLLISPGKDILTSDPDPETFRESEKINIIKYHFEKIMDALGLDLEDDSLKDTPLRVAKMCVTEMFSGLNPGTFPAISLFNNVYHYKDMLIEKDIQVYSCCEHHFVPFVGKAHVGYFPAEKVIGLSKLNRIVKYFSRRPQVQERLTMEIANCLKDVLQTEDVAVAIEAKHLCVAARGVEDGHSATITTHLNGKFEVSANKEAFLSALRAR